ncbi:MAG: 3-keto-5-aminohexanoate cleavage protein [Gemmatimonadetes bacterium]|nr:3-keto-5-aminohexanoate cleavage protein [Gemmatimonadota bacterium]MCC7133231.1 3-keto-5-aminohexanoate cleavage protein [Gemmatimonadales bacterium]
MDKLIITVAPNGPVATKEHTPHVAVTADEVIEQGIACWEAGASILHYHARDKDQKASLDYDYFGRVLEGLRKHTTLIVQISTGWGLDDREGRIRAVDLRPDMMSLNVGSVNFGPGAYVNRAADAEYWAGKMLEFGVRPEIECFDASHVETGIRLWKMGLIEDPPFFDFVLGVPNAISYTPRNLQMMLDLLPAGARWSCIGIARAQLPVTTLGIVMGGNCRVGIEDNIYYSRGVLATNVQLVERTVRLAKELQREIASPEEARQLLGIRNS